MELAQQGILDEETKLARYVTFSIIEKNAVPEALKALSAAINSPETVVGLGNSCITALGANITGLKVMPAQCSAGIEIPSIPEALWIWIRGNDRGEIFHRSRLIEKHLSSAFAVTSIVDSFQYDENRDMSGYIDGTENPVGTDAVDAAIIADGEQGQTGSSFVAVQQWLHNFEDLDRMSTEEKDNTIGRHISDNEEFDAPTSAHVKRSAQENFEPEAFMLRRSMPWVDGLDGGLIFVSFVRTLDTFEAIMDRMIGKDDGVVDALFNFTRPINGAYYWCPPVKDGKLDLSALGI
jgi:porphyrinogen peroxidase|tara:strand:- start:42283 stop:43161 length:879 start_codon:yes stop_codon:yes gene_type:complete